MRVRAVVISAVTCFAATAFAARAAAAGGKARPAVPDLSGSLALNKQLSDDAHQKVRESTERGGGFGRPPGMDAPGMGGPGMGPGGRMGPPPGSGGGDDTHEAMRAVFDPAEELSLYQGQPEIVIDEKLVRRRTLHVDGRKYKADNGASEVKTEWKDGRLVVETRGFGGRRTTETWELSATGKRLTSTVKLETGSGPPVTIKRVYDRAAAAPAPPDRN